MMLYGNQPQFFSSDQDGMIDTSQTASISGSYKGVSEWDYSLMRNR